MEGGEKIVELKVLRKLIIEYLIIINFNNLLGKLKNKNLKNLLALIIKNFIIKINFNNLLFNLILIFFIKLILKGFYIFVIILILKAL